MQATSSNRATAVLTALSKTSGEANTRTLVVTDVEGNAVTFSIDNSLTTYSNKNSGNANSNTTSSLLILLLLSTPLIVQEP